MIESYFQYTINELFEYKFLIENTFLKHSYRLTIGKYS